jgi:hypothetical protein
MKTRKVALPAVVLIGSAAWFLASDARGDSAPPDTSSGRASPVPQAAEGFEWFWAINGPVSADAAGDLSVDAEGSVFIAGGHGGLDMDRDGVVDIESGATAYEGANNPFFMKLSRDPSDDRVRLRWTRSPKTPADRTQTSIAADGRGGAYVAGAFQEMVAFEGGPTLRGAGGNDSYIARYDAAGSVIWARTFGGPGSDVIYRVASDREGHAYAVGVGSGAVLVSYGLDGAVRWSRIFGRGVPLALSVSIAPNGDVVVTGDLEGAVDFDGDSVVDLAEPSDRDGFVARFASDGAFLGAWAIGSLAGAIFGPDGDVYLLSIVGGPMEQRYGPADFDGDGRADVEPKGGPTSGVIARYSPDGDLRWVRSYALEAPADMAVRGGRIVLSGNYHGVRDLDEDGEAERVDRTVDPEDETDLAVLILSAEDGAPERVWTAPGPGNDWANAVAFAPGEPALYVAGSIQLTADFTGDGEFGEGWAVCENLGDVFFAQYRLDEAFTLEAVGAELEGHIEGGLSWSGSSAARVDVYRNGDLITTTENSGAFTDTIERGVRGPWDYRVCEAGTQVCSNEARLSFRADRP